VGDRIVLNMTDVVTAGPSLKLEARSLTKRYGDAVALQDATLSISEGEFLTLLGPSGSGKTTLLSIIAGLTEPSSGELWIAGVRSTALPPNKRDIGMVFQNYALFPHMTVRENVEFPLRMRRKSASHIQREVDQALEMVHLSQFGERLPIQLSGGQQQRVALARAIVYKPSIILMDEPLGALDKKLREHMQSEIRRIHRKIGTTVVYVTHDQDEAMALSDRICLMNNAQIEQIGTPDELYFSPATQFAANFLGESNFLDVVVDVIGERHAQVRDGNGSVYNVKAQPKGLRKDERRILTVRPEMCTLSPSDATGDCVRGTVEDIMMLGALTKVLVRLDSGELFTVSNFTQQARSLEVGIAVHVGWNPDSATLLEK